MSARSRSSVVTVRQDFAKEVVVIRMEMSKERQKELVPSIVNEAVQNMHTGNNYADLGKHIKERMDELCGSPWHCIIGTDFACETSCAGRGYAHFMVDGFLNIIVYRTGDAQCE